MKKQLLAVAVASALPAIAVAQNVTVYGVLDTSVVGAKNGSGLSQTYVSSGANLTSRLGLRGEEDLGGGLKAFFVLEGAMGTDRGTVGTIGNATAASVVGSAGTAGPITDTIRDNNSMFDRAAIVGLEGAFGRIAFGKMKHEAANLQDLYNVTGANLGNMPSGILATATADSGRMNNAVEYRTPSFMGLQAKFQYSAGKVNENGTAGSEKVGRTQNVLLTYRNGPLLVAATQTKEASTATVDITDSGAAVTYDFGVARVGAAFLSSDRDGATASQKAKAYQLTAAVPMGQGLTAIAAFNNAKTEAANDKANMYMVGVLKDLSKRTTLFAAFSSVKNSAGGDFTGSGLPAAGANGADPKGWVGGITHRF